MLDKRWWPLGHFCCRKRLAAAITALWLTAAATVLILVERRNNINNYWSEEARTETERLSDVYVPYDSFHVCPYWTLYDIRRRTNDSVTLNMPYKRSQFPRLDSDLNDDLTRATTNNSRDVGVIIYNRVPKCASTTLRTFVRLLNESNGFTVFSSNVYASHSLPVTNERQFTKRVTANIPAGSAVFFDRHMYHINIGKYSSAEEEESAPNWINFVRHPVDRFESAFYYYRVRKRWKGSRAKPTKKWFRQSIDDCVLRGSAECNFGGESSGGPAYREQQLTYFCGNAPECRRVGSREGLQQAKRNAERGYAVVGVTENMLVSLAVMERMLPRFFRGVEHQYRTTRDVGKRVRNRNPRHMPVSTEARRRLETDMAMELDFYHFIRQRLETIAKVYNVN